MKRGRVIALQSFVSLLILGGLVKTVFDNRDLRVIPKWAASGVAVESRDAAACSAILEWLHAQPWADGSTFSILHASPVRRDFDRYGPDKSRPASVVLIEYLRTTKEPDPASARPSPLQFVFVLDDSGQVIRRLAVDAKHSPYADLFGL